MDKSYINSHRGGCWVRKALEQGFQVDVSEKTIQTPEIGVLRVTDNQLDGLALYGLYALAQSSRKGYADYLRAGLVSAPAGDMDNKNKGSSEPDFGVPGTIDELALESIIEAIGMGPWSMKLSTSEVVQDGRVMELPKKERDSLQSVVDNGLQSVAINKLLHTLFNVTDIKVVEGNETSNFVATITIPMSKMGPTFAAIVASSAEGYSVDQDSIKLVGINAVSFTLLRKVVGAGE